MFQIPWNEIFNVKSKLIDHHPANLLKAERFPAKRKSENVVVDFLFSSGSGYVLGFPAVQTWYPSSTHQVPGMKLILGGCCVCVLEKAVWSGLWAWDPCRTQLSLFHSLPPQGCRAPLYLCLRQASFMLQPLEGSLHPRDHTLEVF